MCRVMLIAGFTFANKESCHGKGATVFFKDLGTLVEHLCQKQRSETPKLP